MALRIRNNKILCAAMYSAQPGDTYIDDGLHYQMSVIHKVIWTDDQHKEHGEWWWKTDNSDYEQTKVKEQTYKGCMPFCRHNKSKL